MSKWIEICDLFSRPVFTTMGVNPFWNHTWIWTRLNSRRINLVLENNAWKCQICKMKFYKCYDDIVLDFSTYFWEVLIRSANVIKRLKKREKMLLNFRKNLLNLQFNKIFGISSWFPISILLFSNGVRNVRLLQVSNQFRRLRDCNSWCCASWVVF